MAGKIAPDKIEETIALNAHRGDSYVIRFKGEPSPCVGIPLLDRMEEADGTFTFKVLEPHEKRGVFQRAIGDIVEMEKA
jgi:hypothetical protein